MGRDVRTHKTNGCARARAGLRSAGLSVAIALSGPTAGLAADARPAPVKPSPAPVAAVAPPVVQGTAPSPVAAGTPAPVRKGAKARKPVQKAPVLDPEVVTVGQATELKFPASAQMVVYMPSQPFEPGQRAKVKMPAADAAQFFADNGFDRVGFREEMRGYLGNDRGGWDPWTNGALPTTARHVLRGRSVYVGAVEAGPEVFIYVAWYTG